MGEGCVSVTVTYVEPPHTIREALERGDVETWNNWMRELRAQPDHQNRNVGASLHDIDLSNLNLTGVDFSCAQIRGARLNHTQLRGANLNHAIIAGAWDHVDLSDARLQNTTINGALNHVIFDRAHMLHTEITGSHIRDSSFVDAHINYAAFRIEEAVERTRFTRASIDNTRLDIKGGLRHVDFTDALFGPYILSDIVEDRIDAQTFASSPQFRERFDQYWLPVPNGERLPHRWPRRLDFEGLLGGIFAQNRGAVFGETHSELAHPEFMAEHMDAFAERGVAVIFLEGMRPHQTQEVFDRFNNHEEGAEDAMFREVCARLREDFNPSHREAIFHMMLEARARGIRIEPIEDRSSEVERNEYMRLRDSNPEWHQNITRRLAELEANGEIERGSRYLVYCGAGHTRDSEIDRGIDAMLGIPAIDFELAEGNMDERIVLLSGGDRVVADAQIFLPDSLSQNMGYTMYAGRGYYSPDRVRQLQQDLRVLGYDVPLNGRFDRPTSEAITAFQRRFELIQTGDADRSTLQALQVAALETYLGRLGLRQVESASDEPDTELDFTTYAAIRDFQRARNSETIVFMNNAIDYHLLNDVRSAYQARPIELSPIALGDLPRPLGSASPLAHERADEPISTPSHR